MPPKQVTAPVCCRRLCGRWLLGAVLAGAVLAGAGAAAAHENVPGDPNPVHPVITPAQAAFDKLFWEIDDGVYPVDSHEKSLAVLARLERAIPPGDTHRRLQHRYMYCLLAFDHAPAGAVEYARDASQDAARAGDPASEAALRFCLGQNLRFVGQGDAAITEYQRATVLARGARDYNVEGLAMVNRGQIHMERGEMVRGLQLLLDGQTVFERGKVGFQTTFNLFRIARAYRGLGDPERALEYVNQVEAYATSRKDDMVLFLALDERGRLHTDQGRFAPAEADLQAALRVAQRMRSAHNESVAYLNMATLYNQSKQPRRALAMLDKAEQALRAAGEAELRAEQLDLERGHAWALLDQHGRALDHFDRALPRLRDSRDQAMLWRLHLLRAESREALGAYSAAMADLRAYEHLRRQSEQQLSGERILLMRYGFDARYRELEGKRLQTEATRAARLADAERAKGPWRLASLGLGGSLTGLLGMLIWRQRRHSLGLRRLAQTDALTGAANRREIERIGAHGIARSRITGTPYCVMMLDLDHFKRINDMHGHAVGDQVLIRSAAAWTAALRQGDHLGRIGGEEFLVLLHGATLEAARQVAQRLLDATRQLDLDTVIPGLKVSVSIGLATVELPEDTLESVMRRADAALYAAKAGGRDRFEVAPPSA